MSEPELSGACHDRWTVEFTRLPVRPGACGIAGSTGSNAANIRLPPDWRGMGAFAGVWVRPAVAAAVAAPVVPAAQHATLLVDRRAEEVEHVAAAAAAADRAALDRIAW